LHYFQVIFSADVNTRTIKPTSCSTQDYIPAEFKVPLDSAQSATKNVSHFNVHWTSNYENGNATTHAAGNCRGAETCVPVDASDAADFLAFAQPET
jgi:hypothetical protein